MQVGSNRSRAGKTIASALVANPPSTALTLITEGPSLDDPSVTVTYELDRSCPGAVVNIAVVDHSFESDVARGENTGRSLRHDNVVRAFRTVPLDITRGRVTLEVPGDLDVAHSSAIAYVQDNSTLRILGAAAGDLAPDNAPRSIEQRQTASP